MGGETCAFGQQGMIAAAQASWPSAGPLVSWNVALYERIHATAASPSWLIAIAACLADAPLFAASCLTAWRFCRKRDGGGALETAVACTIVLSIELTIDILDFHPRPFAAGFGPAWIAHRANNSMPSTHAALTWCMAMVLARHRDFAVASILFALGAVMAWARVYVGIHWPADMLGATVSAAISAITASSLMRAGNALLRHVRHR